MQIQAMKLVLRCKLHRMDVCMYEIGPPGTTEYAMRKSDSLEMKYCFGAEGGRASVVSRTPLSSFSPRQA